MASYVLDTNAITCLVRRNQKRGDLFVLNRLMDALGSNDDVKISVVSKYENLRGLCHKRAKHQIQRLGELEHNLGVVQLELNDWDTAAEEWGRLRRAPARPTAGWEDIDGDLLIATQAKRTGSTVVTNDPDFERLGVETADWSAK